MSGGISATTIAMASLAASAAAAGIGAYGAMQSANAQAKAADYNAQIADQNQQIGLQNARLAGQSGEQQAAISEQKTRAEVGAIKTSQAASGIDVNSGSALDVQSSAASLGELNAITIRSDAAKQAYGYETQSTGFANQAKLDQMQAADAAASGAVAAGSTILGGAGKAGLGYAGFMQSNSPMSA